MLSVYPASSEGAGVSVRTVELRPGSAMMGIPKEGSRCIVTPESGSVMVAPGVRVWEEMMKVREGIGVRVREAWVKTPVGRRGGLEDVRLGLVLELESCSTRAVMAEVGALKGAESEGRGAAASCWMSLSEEDPSFGGAMRLSRDVGVARASKPVAVGWMRTLNSGVLGG